ncbi:ogr/Delta-like zinc finger family protein [Sodalis sp. dw_96]|uniref:ogr/Delta-like zinc finger family protein n=1 Tax=Sodalis sp. dw_96 TaxID=2719794 RepID=UPI001BD6C470|nr:ogr/Delta-like zinc finger family protein [Sodalis sp. dw_96]
MMKCPLCGQSAHARSSRELSIETKERYNQCTNLHCGHTFITMETYIRSIMTPGKVEKAQPHRSNNSQPTLNF